MKRISYIHVTKNLFASVIVMAMGVNVAMAFGSFGANINGICAADGRMPATPYNGDCTLCHDNGGSGGSGAGKTAYRASPQNIDFFCTLPMMNNMPMAHAGPDQSVTAGNMVTLNGTSSSDMDGDTLTYSWMLTAPSGSAAMLSDVTAVMPTFTADIAGTYHADLIVNDGTIDSAVASVTILVTKALPVNLAPVANAGLDQPVTTLVDNVFLDGRGSSDADMDPLTYSWGFSSMPMGSQVMLSGADTARPSFTPDVDGDYVVELVVNDGMLDSAPDSVVISAASETTPPVNIAPVANAGMDQNAMTGATVMLDGNGSSDANNDALSYNWTLITMPMGSTAVLMDATTATPSFVADMAGEYVAQLIVSDGLLESAADTVMISVNDQPMNTPDVTLMLNVDPSMLKVAIEDLGEKEVKVVAKVAIAGINHEDDMDEDERDHKGKGRKGHKDDMDEDDEDDMDDEHMTATPVLVDIYLTSPDGTMKVLKQQHHTMMESCEVDTKFMPAMVGEYIVEAIISDEAGNELASETKTVTVMIVEEDMDDEDDEDEDEHKKGKGKGRK